VCNIAPQMLLVNAELPVNDGEQSARHWASSRSEPFHSLHSGD
jgi:hypothetical protein